MKRLISFERAGQWLMVLLAGLLVFHLLVIVGLVPPEIVWGGDFESPEAALPLQAFTVLMMALFLGATAMRIGLIGEENTGRRARVVLWVMAAYFFVNATGSVAAGVGADNFAMAPFSGLAMLLAFRLALE